MNSDSYPNFIIIGAAKCGTTSLAGMLEMHPDVFVSNPKEPHYFTFGWERKRREYEALFSGTTALFKGEASTTYSQGPYGYSVPNRIWETIPDVRLVYLLRHPVERIRSQYIHRVDRGREERPIERAIREDPSYIEHTRYGHYLKDYLRFFPRSQILVAANEWLRESPRTLIDEVLEFIGAEPERLDPIPVVERNRSLDKRRSLPALNSVRAWARRHKILGLLPPQGRAMLHKTLSRSLDQRETRVSPKLATYIWDHLESDQALLRTLVDPSFPKWEPQNL